MMRIKLTKIVICFIFSTSCIIIWKMFSTNTTNFTSTCKMSDEYMNRLEILMKKVHSIFENYSLNSFLCYGSLWGQIRKSKLLPWSKKSELCIFKEQIDKVNDKHFKNSFTKTKLIIEYDMWEGKFIINDEKYMEPFVEVFIFERDEIENVFKRIGIIRTLLPPSCDWSKSLDCFPTNLIQNNLPKKLLGLDYYNVPMGGVELQKYHYSSNWWKEVKIKNCNV